MLTNIQMWINGKTVPESHSRATVRQHKNEIKEQNTHLDLWLV